jgi:hypothetical protein
MYQVNATKGKWKEYEKHGTKDTKETIKCLTWE